MSKNLSLRERLPLVFYLGSNVGIFILLPLGMVIAYDIIGSTWLSVLIGIGVFVGGLVLFVIGDDIADRIKDAREEREKPIRTAERERTKREKEENYLTWCDEQNEAERILQPLADKLLQCYYWDDMPRIKARLSNKVPVHAAAHYNGTFKDSRKRGEQAIEFKPSYFYAAKIHELEYVMKHELVHAWKDWKGIEGSDMHGPEFQAKAREVGI